jgi:hypothetical protein
MKDVLKTWIWKEATNYVDGLYDKVVNNVVIVSEVETVSNDYVSWTSHKTLPLTLTQYPFQAILQNNDNSYYYVLGTGSFFIQYEMVTFTEPILYSNGGTFQVYKKDGLYMPWYSLGAKSYLDIVNSIFDEANSTISDATGVFFDKTVDDGIIVSDYQMWNAYPNSKCLTEQYPYQLIRQDTINQVIKLHVSTEPFIFKNDRLETETGKLIMTSKLISGAWTNVTSDGSATYWENILETNHDIKNISGSVVLEKTTVDIIPEISKTLQYDLAGNELSIDVDWTDKVTNQTGIDNILNDKVLAPPVSIDAFVGSKANDIILEKTGVDEVTGEAVYEPVGEGWTDTAPYVGPYTPDDAGISTGIGEVGNILSNIREKIQTIIDELTTPATPPDPDLNDKMKNFNLPDLFILFLGVILACIRLMVRFLTFIGQVILKPADSSIIPDGMKQSLQFLKDWNIGLPMSFYTLFSSLMTFFFGLRMIKYIKLFVASIHGFIPDTYDPAEFSKNEVYNQWQKSGYDTSYENYASTFEKWKNQNNRTTWKAYVRKQAKAGKW